MSIHEVILVFTLASIMMGLVSGMQGEIMLHQSRTPEHKRNGARVRYIGKRQELFRTHGIIQSIDYEKATAQYLVDWTTVPVTVPLDDLGEDYYEQT